MRLLHLMPCRPITAAQAAEPSLASQMQRNPRRLQQAAAGQQGPLWGGQHSAPDQRCKGALNLSGAEQNQQELNLIQQSAAQSLLPCGKHIFDPVSADLLRKGL